MNAILMYFLTTTAILLTVLPGICLTGRDAGGSNTGRAVIVLEAPDLAPDDTLQLLLWYDYIAHSFNHEPREFLARGEDGVFRFQLDSVQGLSWLTLHLAAERKARPGVQPVMDKYILSPGDSIHIRMAKGYGPPGVVHPLAGRQRLKWNYAMQFNGPGSEKYRCRWQADSISDDYDRWLRSRNTNHDRRQYLLEHFRQIDRDLSHVLRRIEYHRPGLQEDVYQLLLAEYTGRFGYEKLRSIYVDFFIPERPNASIHHALFKEHLAEIQGSGLPAFARARSRWYLEYLVLRYQYRLFVMTGKNTMSHQFRELLEVQPDLLRDRAVTLLLGRAFALSPDGGILQQAREMVYDRFSRHCLEQLGNTIPGMPAYRFSLPDKDGKIVSLGELRGKVVLMDFWYKSCIHCFAYLEEVVRPVLAEYQDDDRLVFISISTDVREVFLESLEKVAVDGKNVYELYTDGQRFRHEILTHYGITAYPFPLLIGADGNLAERPVVLRSKEGLKKAIEAALKSATGS